MGLNPTIACVPAAVSAWRAAQTPSSFCTARVAHARPIDAVTSSPTAWQHDVRADGSADGDSLRVQKLIESTLEAAGGVQKRAAELLHIKPTTLNEMIKRYEIRPRRKRSTNGTGSEPAPSPQPARPIAGPLSPTGTFDEK